MIAAIRGSEPQQLIGPYVFDGHCDRGRAEVWLERLYQVLPAGRKHYLILDNASFYRGDSLEEIARCYGLQLMYLPPYSPELDPIERC